jgi:protein tyrosine phosphatase (PTP) superfamily phosphohydrolase (DUF442 family)
MPEEPGANIEESKAVAAKVGLKYIHLPHGMPTPEIAEAFLKAVADPANQPVYIDCASANRVGAMWLIKRVRLDGWDVDRATKEAEAIGLRAANLKQLHHEKPVPAALTGMMSRFDNGEVHDGVTDIHFIIAGSGRLSVGGELQNKVNRPISEGSLILHPGESIASLSATVTLVSRARVLSPTCQVSTHRLSRRSALASPM